MGIVGYTQDVAQGIAHPGFLLEQSPMQGAFFYSADTEELHMSKLCLGQDFLITTLTQFFQR